MDCEWMKVPSFYPDPLPVPLHLETEQCRLRALTPEDAVKDHDALLASRTYLRIWSQSAWPEDGFSVEQNRADLDRHYRMHQARAAFTFTIMDRFEGSCLGCLYMHSLRQAMKDLRASESDIARLCTSTDVYVRFWTRTLKGSTRYLVQAHCAQQR